MINNLQKNIYDRCQPLGLADLERFRDESMRAENEARHAEKVKAFLEKIPRRYRDKSLANFIIHTPEQETVKFIVTRFIETFAERVDEGTSLIFLGNPGTGKTLLSLIIYQALAAQHYHVKYESSLQFLRVIQEKKYESNSAYQAILKSYTDADFLILDEVTETVTKDGSPSEFEKRLLFDVINARYEMGNKSSLLISNRSQAELAYRIGAPVMDRILEKGILLGFSWGSFRS